MTEADPQAIEEQAVETVDAPPPPRDYRLMVPQGWVRIALDPEVWPRRIAALVDDHFRGVDNAPHLKAQMREQLAQRAQECWEGGGLELYLSMMVLEGIPVSASLLVTLIQYDAERPRVGLEELAIAYVAEGQDATMKQLPAGFALVHRYLSEPRNDMGSTFSDTHYDVTVPLPNSEKLLLLSFSTPVEPLADALVELFESIAYSLTWRV